MPRHLLRPVPRQEVESKLIAVVYAPPFDGIRADIVNPGQEIGQVPGPLHRILRIRYLPASNEPGNDARHTEQLARCIQKDGFRRRDAVPTGDLQPVKVSSRSFGVRLIGHPLNDEMRPLPVGRNRVEHVDGVGKRSLGGSNGKEPAARHDGINNPSTA